MNVPEDSVSESAFKRSYDSLQGIFAFIESFFSLLQIDRKHLGVVELAVEELFTNMVKYCPDNDNDILIGLEQSGRQLAVSLTDFDVEPFDITKIAEVNVDRPILERRPGGLGIHLVKKMVDRIDYDYADRTSRTTIIKALE